MCIALKICRFNLIQFEVFIYLVKLRVVIVGIAVVIVATAVVNSLFSAVGLKVEGVSFTMKETVQKCRSLRKII